MSDPIKPTLTAIDGGKERRVLRGNDIENITPPESLVGDLLDRDSIAIIYGGWGQYKTFLSMDIAWCIASGKPWDGLPTAQGPVLYFIGEGFSGVGQRQSAWKQYNNLPTANPDVYWVEGIPSVTTPSGRRELESLVRQYNPVFTVIDTVARSVSGIPENDSETMSKVIDALDTIRIASSGGTALGVHHAGRDKDSMHMRGHSSLDGGVDSILQMHGKRLYIEKQRNHEAGYTYCTFDVQPVTDSLVLVPIHDKGLSPKQQNIIDALKALGKESNFTDLKNAAHARGVSAGYFPDALKGLVDSGTILRDHTDHTGVVYRII